MKHDYYLSTIYWQNTTYREIGVAISVKKYVLEKWYISVNSYRVYVCVSENQYIEANSDDGCVCDTLNLWYGMKFVPILSTSSSSIGLWSYQNHPEEDNSPSGHILLITYFWTHSSGHILLGLKSVPFENPMWELNIRPHN